MDNKITVFKDLLKYIPQNKFAAFVAKHDGDKWSKKVTCWDILIALLQGHLNSSKSLRLVETVHNFQKENLQSIGSKKIPLSTLSDACKTKSPEVFLEVFNWLLGILQKHQALDTNIKRFVHLIDSTPIMLKGNGFEWAKNNYRITGLKLHVEYDKQLESPVSFTMTDANVNDVSEGKALVLRPNRTYVFDKAYCDFKWWQKIADHNSYFVTRIKKNTPFVTLERRPIKDEILEDYVIKLISQKGRNFKGKLRYIKIRRENNKDLIIISNDLKSSATKLGALYKQRWDIELFFKCLKQNLKIKQLWGRSENAVKLQIITGLIAYVLLRIIQTRSGLPGSIMRLRIIMSLSLYKRGKIYSLLPPYKPPPARVQMPERQRAKA